MKKAVHRFTALALSLALLASTASAALGSLAYTRSTSLSDGASLTNGTWTVSGSSSTVRENYVEYRQESAVLPIVAFGSTLYGRSTMSEIAQKVNAAGYTVVAGINGSFFDLNNGIPYGLVVTDGILRSSGNTAAVGFAADGKAVIGQPQLKVTVTAASGSWEVFYNKALTQANGMGLYSADYDTRTKNSIDAYHVVLKPTGGQKAALSLKGSLALEVTGIQKDAKSCEIPADGFVLCMAEDTLYPTALGGLQTLQIGDAVTVATSVDAQWTNVVHAVGGGDLLVENGRAATTFELDSASKSAARTAVGIKNDGSLVFYTADGGNGSKGLTLSELAERMGKLGCTTALNLDGGGSTSVGVQYPGYLGNTTVNRPEDGSLRACANYIFLVRKTQPAAQTASRLFLYPYNDQPVLPGASVNVTVKGVDQNYAATVLPGELTYTVKNGTMDDKGVLTVSNIRSSADPYVTVTAISGAASGTVRYTILDEVTAISVKREGASGTFSKAMLAGGSVTELSAVASYYGMSVAAQDESFTWSVDEQIGTISPTGTFTAAQTNTVREGTITVSYGRTKAEIAVTIAPADPFTDMKGHWAQDFVNELYFSGVLTGSAGADGKQVYRPDASMTRQEFIVALMRYVGVNVDSYASVQLPFVDKGKIANWAENAIKAAYQLKYLGGSSNNGKLYANPTSTITRQEAMLILSRTTRMPSPVNLSVLNQFSDAAKIDSWAKEALAGMVELGVIAGSNGKVDPLGKVTRAQVAKMLYFLMHLEDQ